MPLLVGLPDDGRHTACAGYIVCHLVIDSFSERWADRQESQPTVQPRQRKENHETHDNWTTDGSAKQRWDGTQEQGKGCQAEGEPGRPGNVSTTATSAIGIVMFSKKSPGIAAIGSVEL